MATSSTFRPLRVLYKTLSGDWRDVGNDNEFLTPFYTLTSNPVELKVDLTDESVSDLYLSEHTIQWRYGPQQTYRGAQFKHTYSKPGKDSIQVYIAKSDGTVVSRGDIEQIPNPIVVEIKNYLGTNVFLKPLSGNYEVLEEELTDDMIADGVQPSTFTVAHLTAGQISMPLRVVTSHTWQLYSDTNTPNKVTLYADMAGMRHIYNESGEVVNRATETAPLKTASYDDNKYAQFQKTWRWTNDSAGQNPIDHTYTTDTKLFVKKRLDNTGYDFCDESDPGSEFVGTSGSSIVYYIDDSRSLVYDDGDLHGYRLLAQLDTTDWPDLISDDVIDTKTFNNSDTKINTPQIYQATYDKLFVDVAATTPERLVFTSSGINSPNFSISKNKFQNTKIPFVMSAATSNGTIIKDVPNLSPDIALVDGTYFTVTNMVIIPDGMFPPNPADMVEDTYYVGLSSQTPHDTTTMSIEYNNTLSHIRTYSSLGLVLTSSKEMPSVRLVGAVKSSEYGLITGMSDTFNIQPQTGKHTFFKTAEGVDYGQIMNSYILQENINQHDRLGSMLNSIFGEFNDLPTAMGKVIYEKIANFTRNTIDIDTCTLQSLYGLAEEVQYEFENYNFSYPGGVRRIVDTLSIGIRKLVGDRDRYGDDFTDTAIYRDNGNIKFGRNIGDMVDIDTYVVRAGDPIIVKEIYGNNYFKIIPSCIPGADTTDPHYTTQYNINGLSAYPLSSYDKTWNWGLTYPDSNIFSDYYEFYSYIDNTTYPLTAFDQNTGIIDWTSTNKLGNTMHVLDENVGSYDEWYGKSQKVENMIEFSLRKGLQIL